MSLHQTMFALRAAAAAVLLLIAISCIAATLNAAEPVELFNGKDLTGWKEKGDHSKSKWAVGTATMDPDNTRTLKITPGGNQLINGGHGVDLFSERWFGDAVIELELMVPKDSNSGIYVMGEYEIQILDSFGKTKLGMGDMGAIYGAAVPRANACKPPGEWQKYVIEYRAPKFDQAGKKIANAKIVKVMLNGKVIQENAELRGPTPGGVTGREAASGPLMFQGNHGPVAFRNITIKEM